jgi:broad specificity phosphatase PhoE
MRSETLVHVVRHGEVYNPDKILYGRLPGFGLSDFGVAQAEKTAEFLAPRDISYLVSSPLERAIQTATPLAEKLGVPIERDDRLIEAANRFEGQPVAGGTGRIFSPSNWKLLYNPVRPSWGEPYAEIAARVRAAVLAAAAAADGHEAACITHQLPVVALRRQVLGEHLWHDPRERQCALASVTTFAVDGDQIRFYAYAEPAGATPAGSTPGA